MVQGRKQNYCRLRLAMSNNVFKQEYSIQRSHRELALGQKAHVLWFTGLSGSGKSALADRVAFKLSEMGFSPYVLDGDNTRLGLNKDLGFTEADRSENLRRVAELSKILVDAGLVVLAAFVSPLNSDRQLVSEIIGDQDFTLIHVDCSLEVCEARDVKGLYKRARAGEIKNFTGISAAFEIPNNTHINVNTSDSEIEECVEKVLAAILPTITR